MKSAKRPSAPLKSGRDVENDCPDFGKAKSSFYGLRNLERATGLAELIKVRKDDLQRNGRALHDARAVADAASSRTENARGEIFATVCDFFTQYDLLVTPTVLAPPFDAKMLHVMEVEGHKFEDFFEYLALTYIVTLTTCPAISIPCGFTKAGLPVGLQLVGKPRGEAGLLAAAAAIEGALAMSSQLPIDPRP